jgi:hypothetical protein
MGCFSLTHTPHYTFQFHSFFAVVAFRSKPFLSLQFHQTSSPHKRTILKLRAQSQNGTVLLPSEEKPDATNYGRQYFPLAAVVGQVMPPFLSLRFVTISFIFIKVGS